jgi:hypothetical protein
MNVALKKLKYETPEQWRERTGAESISDFLPCYTRRSDNDSWHLDWYLTAIQPKAYCNEYGTPQIFVVNPDFPLRLPDGASISAVNTHDNDKEIENGQG